MHPVPEHRNLRELGVMMMLWTLITLVLFWPVVVGVKSVFFGDLALYFIPQFGNIAEALREGKLLLWNHTILGGVPHVGNPQGWLLYPTVWLNAVLPAWHVAGLIPVIHTPIAALGMHTLARRLGLSIFASMVAAGTFAFSSVLLTKAQFPNMVQAIAWTPWILVAVLSCLRRPGLKTSMFVAVTGSLSVCAGHAQITWMDALICIAIVVWKCRSGRTLRWLCIAAVAIVLLSAAYLLPMVEIAGWSGRDHMSMAQANRFRVPMAGLSAYMTDVHPGGDPYTPSGFRWAGNTWEISAYFGVMAPVIVMLMGLPLLMVKHRLRILILASLALCTVGWWLSAGIQGGLYPFVFRFVPGAKAFHDPARFLHFVHIGVPLVIGGVLSTIGTSRGGRIVGAVLGLANVATLLYVSPTWYPLVSSDVWKAAADHYRTHADAVIYTQNDRSVWLTFANPKTFAGVQTDKRVREFLMSGIPNIPGTWGVVSIGGYEPVAPKSSMSMQGWTGAKPIEDRNLLADLGVTQLVQGSNLVTDLTQHKRVKGRAQSRIVNGWFVSSKGDGHDVALKVMREAGWEIVDRWTLSRLPNEAPGQIRFSGTGRVKYHPASFRLGLFFTLVALGILAGITLHTVQFARKA